MVQLSAKTMAAEYEIKRPLGSGHFGDVYLAKKGGRCYAIKKVVNTEQNTAQQEIRILKKVDHPFIIKYHGHYMERRVLCIVLEYADKGTLEQAVRRKTAGYHEVDVWRLIGHLSSALDYLHSMIPQVLHHDLKPDNVLGVNEPVKPPETGHKISFKLVDFGVAKMLTREAQEEYYGADNPGVPTYMGPEVLHNFENYSATSDMWSLGCVIAFVMRNGEHVFNCNEDVLYYEPGMEDMIFGEGAFNAYSPDLQEVIYSLLQVVLKFLAKFTCSLYFVSQVDPYERPTAEEVLAMCTDERQHRGVGRYH